MKKVVQILSGGMDSATLAYYLKERNDDLRLVSFDYGQRHVKELDCARKIAKHLGSPHTVISLDGLSGALSSVLTQHDQNVPEGHYAQENMKQTVVPNRNAIMLSMAWGIAQSIGAEAVCYGAHAGDHEIYPDCRKPFVDALTRAFFIGGEGLFDKPTLIEAPFVQLSKGDIVALGLKLNVPYKDTWTCYKGWRLSCGKCGCCVERQEAFAQNGVKDPLPYSDSEFWKEAIAKYQTAKG